MYTVQKTRHPHLSRSLGDFATRLSAEVDGFAPGPVPHHKLPPALDEVASHAVPHDA